MDINAISNMNSVLRATETGDKVKLAVAKKAMDIQKQQADDLIQALPKPSSNPEHLGNSVDVHV